MHAHHAGDSELLLLSMDSMNSDPDPEAEDRKGCSGHVGKMIYSAGVTQAQPRLGPGSGSGAGAGSGSIAGVGAGAGGSVRLRLSLR